MKKGWGLLGLMTVVSVFGYAVSKPESSGKITAERETAAKKAPDAVKTAEDDGLRKNAEAGSDEKAEQAAAVTEKTFEMQAKLLLETTDSSRLTAYIGSDPQQAFTAFGLPVSLNVLRGEDSSLDDVVSVHEAGVYLFWFQDRVWQIGFGSYFAGAFEGIKIGMKENEVIDRLGKPLLSEKNMIVYEIFHREFPVSMRFVLKEGSVSEMYLYRSDL